MSNVYGAISSTNGLLDVFDPYAVTTDAVTLLSFSASESPQNQMRDLAKVIKKKLPVDTTNTELVFPFNSALFTSPLTVGNNKSSGGSMEFFAYKNNFNWSSLDIPEVICAKWKAVMEPYVTFGGTSGSYGHAVLTHDRTTGKYIYKPVIRICGGVLVNSVYTGQDSFFSGDIIGRSSTGDAYNIVDNLELLNSELLLSKESITILSCTAAADSWVIATNNQYTPFQVIATPAYDPTVINALNKVSPPFNNITLINADPNWPVTTGWKISQSSYYQSNASFVGWKAFDRLDSTYWASAELAYSFSGVGNQWVQIEYPEAVKMVSHEINPYTSLTVGVPLQWALQGSNNNSTFVTVETFQFNSWQANKVETFVTTQSHVAYKYWRITITLIRTAGAAIHAVLYELAFNSGWSIGLQHSLTMNKFKRDSTNLARATYMSLPQAGEFVKTLGYTLDTELSRPNTMVFVDQNGQPTVAHRGSVTAKDWLVDDALIALRKSMGNRLTV
ncbi:hypothetical protein T492DRAFT_838770 [Pavlovales sp. CCMP2436]|nr:hypothetical protein T492DRAFT_838770 [Pavlovales sp. CCMP2436]